MSAARPPEGALPPPLAEGGGAGRAADKPGGGYPVNVDRRGLVLGIALVLAAAALLVLGASVGSTGIDGVLAGATA